MKLVRPVVAVVVGAGLVLAGSAGAAVKKPPVCNLVTDPAGDANGFVVTGTPLPSDDFLDIVSADIASDAKNLTAVIRLKAVGADSTAPTGGTVYFNFTIGDSKSYVAAVLDGKGGATFSAGDFTGTPGRKQLAEATGFVDAKTKEIHITAPANTWSASIKSGVKLSALGVLAQRYIGGAGVGFTPTADDSVSEKIYTAGTKSCVTPGK